ncbi:unnamed protein product [Acanthoscelides obtectus]|uniref:CCHC-type domain-containing protein n=1 Tax=Acanthoscelides obtectus TaxID=200917 RepID=A0A9P0JSG7_ACAOB|nr:unnamed protein product [Acanthoscelides obtectus]CAK1673821.1 hypothetical protein AOBTE_LOCUS29448 [Acanthoscelides obtectus]
MDQRVIRGLPREMAVNDIKEDLVSQGIADAVVQQLTSRTTKKPLPLFLVKTKMPEKLAEIQRLAMLTVSFERKKKSSEPSQCYRCQRYGHTQRNCRLAERIAFMLLSSEDESFNLRLPLDSELELEREDIFPNPFEAFK